MINFDNTSYDYLEYLVREVNDELIAKYSFNGKISGSYKIPNFKVEFVEIIFEREIGMYDRFIIIMGDLVTKYSMDLYSNLVLAFGYEGVNSNHFFDRFTKDENPSYLELFKINMKNHCKDMVCSA